MPSGVVGSVGPTSKNHVLDGLPHSSVARSNFFGGGGGAT